MKKSLPLIATLASLAALPAVAQDAAPAEVAAAVSADVVYIFNTLLFLIGGFLVMWMAAGFAMLEAGLVRSKNVTTQLFKNIALFGIAGIMYWLIGYNLMYPGDWTVPGVVGEIFSPKTIDPVGAGVAGDGYSAGSDFFFQLMFCATTASIVSGTLAERVRLNSFLVFTVVLTGLIYPVQASWQWGGGFLSEMGFSDFAGSTLVHSAGGWAALAGALVLGARAGKYRADGRMQPMPGSNLALATLGTFILWLGWFGFNGASQLAIGSVNDAADVSRIFVNTNMAASAGAVAAIIVTQLAYGKIDLTMVLNGALAGLVSITAEPLTPSIFAAVLIGGIGATLACLAVPMLDRFKIDDVVGAIPVHLIAGIWGTLIVPATNPDTGFVTQIIGIVAIGAFVFSVSLVVWLALRAFGGIRVSQDAEITGLDISEMGMEAYPDFVQAK
ncbi:MAG: ammonium transporter [Paracoccus sp. (in: a-proteobacteria)]|uniref:ammonium transporter n=1 Tax=unclassified Paracoccus (in: a-proteobacteria) TaxID=2688777 RepID=UPI000C4068C4|nr:MULTISPECIES: ammonium transporter [unclassified Paracoccus (in: a-proteobacteria)]MBA49094.1 ammonium transporter [Paracoccus sp. (in: a-proteobacteria)]